MVQLIATKIVNEEMEKKEISKIIFTGNIKNVKFSLTMTGEKEHVDILRNGLGIEGYGHVLNMDLKPGQAKLSDFEGDVPKELPQRDTENENQSE